MAASASGHFPPTITYNVTTNNGVDLFYRAAGSPHNPTILLLHGFPSSSNQFRNLIPILAASYYVLAPDLPGYGFTTVPNGYKHTFANLATTTLGFLDALNIKEFAVYIFDYGAPTGFRIALERPHAVKAIISQNGNAYNEGFGHPFWDPIMKLWDTGAEEDRQTLKDVALTLEFTKGQYTIGTPADRLDKIDPTTWTADYYENEMTPEDKDVQVDLFYDYRTNVDLYPKFQEYFRKSQVPTLAVWGKNDIIFIPPGAEAFKRDLKDVEVKLLDGGHFLLETHLEEVAASILKFLKGKF